MLITEKNNQIEIRGAEHFCALHTFDCGQCFRWEMEKDGSFTGVVHGRVVNISSCEDKIIIKNANMEDYNLVWREYLDLERDYGEIKKRICRDSLMEEAIGYGWGIHILKQDLWETIISFILSQQSNIPKIKRGVESLCKKYGKELSYEGKKYYSFPSPEEMASATEEDFKSMGFGYRAKYIKRAIDGALDGSVDLDRLKSLPPKSAREELLKIYGIGEKVANCIMLFSLGDMASFPVDVWIRRVMEEHYSKEGKPQSAGEQLFGKYSGFAQQYLFYWRKEQQRRMAE